MNNSNKMQGPDPPVPQHGWEGWEMQLFMQGHPQHHCLGLCSASCIQPYCLFRSCSPALF